MIEKLFVMSSSTDGDGDDDDDDDDDGDGDLVWPYEAEMNFVYFNFSRLNKFDKISYILRQYKYKS